MSRHPGQLRRLPFAPPIAVIEYSDGSRFIWPDDYDTDELPTIGDSDPDGMTVIAVLNAEQLTIEQEEPSTPIVALRAPYSLRDRDQNDPLPTTTDFETVNRSLGDLAEFVAKIHDVDHLRRLCRAEIQGRGIAALPRRGALALLDAAIDTTEQRTR